MVECALFFRLHRSGRDAVFALEDVFREEEGYLKFYAVKLTLFSQPKQTIFSSFRCCTLDQWLLPCSLRLGNLNYVALFTFFQDKFSFCLDLLVLRIL